MTDHDLPGGYSRTDPNDSNVIVRRARKAHHCAGGHDGSKHTACSYPIAPTVLYIEYTGESIPFMSGTRYHLDCAVQQGLLKRDPHTPNPLKPFDQAWNEFTDLEGVDDDPARCKTIADLVYIAQFEIDLAESGESEIDVTPHRKFVRKWDEGDEEESEPPYDEPDPV